MTLMDLFFPALFFLIVLFGCIEAEINGPSRERAFEKTWGLIRKREELTQRREQLCDEDELVPEKESEPEIVLH